MLTRGSVRVERVAWGGSDGNSRFLPSKTCLCVLHGLAVLPFLPLSECLGLTTGKGSAEMFGILKTRIVLGILTTTEVSALLTTQPWQVKTTRVSTLTWENASTVSLMTIVFIIQLRSMNY